MSLLFSIMIGKFAFARGLSLQRWMASRVCSVSKAGEAVRLPECFPSKIKVLLGPRMMEDTLAKVAAQRMQNLPTAIV